MDNPATESSEPLNAFSAASALADFLDQKEPEKEPEAENPEDAEPVAEEPEESEAPTDEPESESEKFTVKIDGKDVEVTLDELKNGYQRQQDYTRKTMEVAETRKQAETEFSKAREERIKYAEGLQQQHFMLHAALQQQDQIDWNRLIETDPVEYLKQKNLYEQRQSALQKTQQDYQRLEQQQAEETKAYQAKFLAQQQEELLAKLPEWKDEAKAKADKSAIRDFLINQGYGDQDIESLSDHRAVIVARKAMLYDQMIANAKAAEKRVQNAPQKVVKPGNSAPNPTLDKRSAAWSRLNKTGSINDAATLFASLL